MTIDLTGGLPASREAVFAECPENPDLREGVNIWLHDDEGRFSLPRFGVEALAADWTQSMVQANIAFPDGRVLIGSCTGPAHAPLDDLGRPSVIGAGPVEFRMGEPFKTWTMTFSGDALDTTVYAQLASRPSTRPRVPVEITVDLTMVVPPWIQGEMGEKAKELMANGSAEALAMGGNRYEQLFRATGTFRAGDEEFDFTASGLRIHRQGVRDTGDFRGHCWQSAVFPSGKAFGYIAFPDYPDGTPSYSEGFVFDGEQMLPAAVVEAPWLDVFKPEGGEASLVLETEHGIERISGSTTTSTVIADSSGAGTVAAMTNGKKKRSNGLFFNQGGARYEWNGEAAYGMVERSVPVGQTVSMARPAVEG